MTRVLTALAFLACLFAPLAPSPANGAGGTCAVIGDSNTARMGETALRNALDGQCSGGLYFYGVGGKELLAADSKGMTTPENIRAAHAQLGHVDHWLIALGTNSLYMDDSTFRTSVQRILGAIAWNGGGSVAWVDIAFFNEANTKAQAKNPVLRSAVTDTGATYLPWNAWIHDPARFDPGDWLAPADPTHMTAQGYAKRAAYYADHL